MKLTLHHINITGSNVTDLDRFYGDVMLQGDVPEMNALPTLDDNALRVPVAFALGLAVVPVFFIDDRLTPVLLMREMFKSYNAFILLAVPFFLLAANLMNSAGITDRLIRLARALVGHFPGTEELFRSTIGQSQHDRPEDLGSECRIVCDVDAQSQVIGCVNFRSERHTGGIFGIVGSEMVRSDE